MDAYDCSSEQARAVLKVHIDNLRKKIQPAPDKPGHILNLRGFGYLSAPRGFRLKSRLRRP
jgi:DNA-binding response OmpR family regulator